MRCQCGRFVSADGWCRQCDGECPVSQVGDDCSVSRVGDREWWCSTHWRNAEDCKVVLA